MCTQSLCKVKDLPFALDLGASKAHASPMHPLFWQCILCTGHIWISHPRGQTEHVTFLRLEKGHWSHTNNEWSSICLQICFLCKSPCTNYFAFVEFIDGLGWSAVLICSDSYKYFHTRCIFTSDVSYDFVSCERTGCYISNFHSHTHHTFSFSQFSNGLHTNGLLPWQEWY